MLVYCKVMACIHSHFDTRKRGEISKFSVVCSERLADLEAKLPFSTPSLASGTKEKHKPICNLNLVK